MTTRRAVIVLGLAAFARTLPSFAQQSATRRIGFLYYGSRESALSTGRYDAFLRGMREQGYVAGKHFTLEERFAAGNTEALAAATQELIGLKVDVIVATGNQAVLAAQKATTRVPIVVTATSDPIRDGFARTLERPGGNITGLYSSSAELVTKQLELLQFLLPKLSRLAVLSNPASAGHPVIVKNVKAFCVHAGIGVQTLQAGNQDDINHAFTDMVRERSQALLICADTFFLQQAPQISELALKHKLPTVAWHRTFTAAGALMSYGQDSNDNFRLAAGYVDKIFKGANPATLPFSRTPKVSFVVNRRTFQALRLKLPREIESRVDEVIE